VGGHCIPIDPIYLAHKASGIGSPSKFIELAQEINLTMPDYFLDISRNLIGDLRAKKILVVGIAYKSDVADMRESPALALIPLLRKAGAEVFWHDDLVRNWNGEFSSDLNSSYDLAILINPHSHTDLLKLGSIPVLNTRGGY